MPVSATTGTPQSRYRPVTMQQPLPNTQLPQSAFDAASAGTRAQPPGPPQMAAPDEPPGGYNNPATAPVNDPMALPPKAGARQPFAGHKAQGGDGPANNPVVQDPTGHPPVVPTATPTTPARPAGVRPLSPLQTTPVSVVPPVSPVGSNLRGDIYTPGGDQRLMNAQQGTDNAAYGVATMNRGGMQAAGEDRYRGIFGTGQLDPNGFAANTDVRFRGINPTVAKGAAVDPMESERTARYGSAQDQALEGLNGPDRTTLALQKLKDFDAASNEQRFNEERDLGRNIAKFGRVGMQANADNFGEITRKIEADRGRLRNELAASVAEGDIADRFRRVDAVSGLRGMESGIDAGMRGERRTERDYGTGLDERNYGRAANERDLETALDESNLGRQANERNTRLGIATGNLDRSFDRSRAAIDTATGQTDRGVGDRFDQLNAAASLEDRIFGQGRDNRNEMRTERDYQSRDAQQTIENRIREMGAQNAIEDMRLRRNMAIAQAGGL